MQALVLRQTKDEDFKCRSSPHPEPVEGRGRTKKVEAMTNPIADPIVEVPDTDAMTPLVHLDSTPEGAVTVWINRPAKKNAFDAATIAALHQAFETLHGAEGVRIVFLRGVGGAF